MDAEAFANQAMADLDANKDGILDEKELVKAPGLKAFARSRGKTSLKRDELVERIGMYQREAIGYSSAVLRFSLDNRPLVGAKITLTPEPWMGPKFKQATGTTDESGHASMKTEGGAVPGAVQIGMYRIEVSRPSEAGQETIPARYNTQTTLGLELGPTTGRSQTTAETTFALSSR